MREFVSLTFLWRVIHQTLYCVATMQPYKHLRNKQQVLNSPEYKLGWSHDQKM